MYTIYPMYDLYLNVYERSSDHVPVCQVKKQKNGKKTERSGATSFHGVNLSIHAAKNIAFHASRLRCNAMNNVSVHIFFCISIAIDVLEPGTDLSSEYITLLDRKIAVITFTRYLFFRNWSSPIEHN